MFLDISDSIFLLLSIQSSILFALKNGQRTGIENGQDLPIN